MDILDKKEIEKLTGPLSEKHKEKLKAVVTVMQGLASNFENCDTYEELKVKVDKADILMNEFEKAYENEG